MGEPTIVTRAEIAAFEQDHAHRFSPDPEAPLVRHPGCFICRLLTTLDAQSEVVNAARQTLAVTGDFAEQGRHRLGRALDALDGQS